MKYGLPESTCLKICTVFAKYAEIDKAILYGSRAKGNFKVGSDIDLTLYGERINLRIFNSIANDLDDLLLPHSIDLSLFSDIQNQDLLEHIDKFGVLFYEKFPNL